MSIVKKAVLVTGASGLLGIQLVKKLSETNHTVIAIGRHKCPQEINHCCDWIQFDISQPGLPEFNVDVLIHAAPLWLLPDFFSNLSAQSQVKRCIAFSSTSARSKVNAIDAEDRKLADKLLSAEAEIRNLFDSKLNYTIFRPTMIYGYGKDANVTTIAQSIRRYGFFPVAGKASGLRQPVHVDDLVAATIAVVENQQSFSKIYNLTGAETLTYKQMVARIFEALNRRPRIIHIPVSFYRLLIRLYKSDYSSGVADRMNQDLAYNSVNAVNDFNYQAQNFLTQPDRDLPGYQ